MCQRGNRGSEVQPAPWHLGEGSPVAARGVGSDSRRRPRGSALGQLPRSAFWKTGFSPWERAPASSQPSRDPRGVWGAEEGPVELEGWPAGRDKAPALLLPAVTWPRSRSQAACSQICVVPKHHQAQR